MLALGFLIGVAIAAPVFFLVGYFAGADSRIDHERADITPALRRFVMKLIIPANELPGTIRESARCVLKARGFKLLGRDGQELTETEAEGLLRELGNNIAQALYGLDENLDNR